MLAVGVFGLTSVSAWGVVSLSELALVGSVHTAVFTKTPQSRFNDLISHGKNAEAFDLAFETGDTLFATEFNALDGSGNNVGNGERFTHVPRSDLRGPTQWFNHTPARVTGPNARSCAHCHNRPVDDAAGDASANVHRDPRRNGVIGEFIQRNTPHLFGQGGLQVLAEEMTTQLRGKLTAAIAGCTAVGCTATVSLVSKGVDFGTVVITRTDPGPTPPNNCSGTDAIPFIDPVDCLAGVTADITGLRGIARDVVVRPFQWKGAVAFVRDFNRDASNNEIGMQAVEIAGTVDGDFDGVSEELGIGDESALAVYIAAQPRPTTRQELARLKLIPALTYAENAAIGRGGALFGSAGCASCHMPSLTIDHATFAEPSGNPNFRDELFPSGINPLSVGVDPAHPIRFDLTRDQPDNRVKDPKTGKEFRLGSFEPGPCHGSAVVRLYGDLKRHEMGPRLAEQVDEIGSGASTWLTENLWGVGSTSPYLHDGRATTLTEAILEHGGEAQASRDQFAAFTPAQKKDLVAFLDNLVLFVVPAAN
ncbi:MAG TPA: di-heme oxidoredictase family protein [Polyangia bacterium]|nr:di-heme oxidoredictase family protein [Polyangia bacterium]